MTVLIIILTFAGIAVGGLLSHIPGSFFGGLAGCLLGLVIGLWKRVTILEKKYGPLQDYFEEFGKYGHKSAYGTPDPAAPPEISADRTTEKTAAPETRSKESAPEPSPVEMEIFTQPDISPEPSIESSDEPTFIFDSEANGEEPVPPPLPFLQSSDRENEAFSGRINQFLTTTNIVVGVGLIVLFFGVAFLLKFAIERGMLSLEMRYIGVCLLGGALLAVGWGLRKRRRDFALLLQGGAVGILYIAVFSAARRHELIPLPMAFFIMVALVVLSGMLAVLQNARGMAALAATGGFLAPVLTSTGVPRHVPLFSYYALLGAGICGAAFFKAWRELNLIGFLFTLVIGGFWGIRYYRPEFRLSTEFFLVLFFLLYLTVSILYTFRRPPKLKGLIDGTLVLGLPIAAFGLQAGLMKNTAYGQAWSALSLGGFYLFLTAVLWRRRHGHFRQLIEAFSALGVVFCSLAVPLALDARWTAAAWALEGAALVWVGLRQNRMPARCFGFLLVILAGAAVVPEFFTSRVGRPVINGVFLSFFMVSLGSLLSSYYQRKNRDRLRKWERPLHAVFLVWGLIWWYLAGFMEIDEFIPSDNLTGASIGFLTLSALIWSGLYSWFSWKTLKYIIFCLLPVLILVALGQTTGLRVMHPFGHLGFPAWPCALAAQYILLRRHENDLDPTIRIMQHAASFILTVFLLTWEAAWGLDNLVKGAGSWWFISWGFWPALLAAGVITLGKRIQWPIKKNDQSYFGIGVPILLAGCWLWLIYGSLAESGDPRPFGYIVIFNPLELTQLWVMGVLSIWFYKVRKGGIPGPFEFQDKWIIHVLSGALFILANTILARAVHHYGHVPWNFDALWTSMVFQAGISIFWTTLALSLMAAAAGKGWRSPWFAGAALLGVVVVKLFLVDLSKTGTIARIISFMVVGLLMLLIGYLSPLPPRSERKVER